MRILVTGAAGFIGSNFVHYRLDRHPQAEVIPLDLLASAGTRANLEDVDEPIAFVEGDIADPDLGRWLLEDDGAEIVVNFAAESHNSLAVVDPGRFLRTTVIGTQTLLVAARQA